MISRRDFDHPVVWNTFVSLPNKCWPKVNWGRELSPLSFGSRSATALFWLLSPCKIGNREFESDYHHRPHFLPIQLFQRKYFGYNLGAVSLSWQTYMFVGRLEFVHYTRSQGGKCCANGVHRQVRVFYDRKDPQHTLFCRQTLDCRDLRAFWKAFVEL